MILYIMIHAFSSFALAQQNCPGPCTPVMKSLSTKETELQRVQTILQKNEEYLKKNTSISASISVKIRSNILISRLQIETVQNEKTMIEKTIKQQGCSGCKIKNTKDI